MIWSCGTWWKVIRRSCCRAGLCWRIRFNIFRYSLRLPCSPPDQSRGRYWYFSESRYSSPPTFNGVASKSSNPEYTPQVGDRVAARVARMLNPAGPEVCRYRGLMSGVLTKKLGR